MNIRGEQLKICRVTCSPLFSSAAYVSEALGRQDCKEYGWPRVLVLFIFVKVGWSGGV